MRIWDLLDRAGPGEPMLSYDELSPRCSIVNVNNLGTALKVDFNGLMFDGTMDSCNCGGSLAGVAFEQCGEAGYRRYHGCRDLSSLISDYGIQRPAHNSLKGMHGWFHYAANMGPEGTMQYSMPQRMLGCETMWRIFLEYDVRCWMSCRGGRTWNYTKDSCKRYKLLHAYVMPMDQVSHIRVMHPPSEDFVDEEDL